MSVMRLGGSSVITANVGPAPDRPSVSALPQLSRKQGPSIRRQAPVTTGVIESPAGLQRVTGKFRTHGLTPNSLHRIVRDTIPGVDAKRENQSRVNLQERLPYLYDYGRTSRLREEDQPVTVRMWVSAITGTIEDLEGHRFDLDGPTDLAPVTMTIYRKDGVLKVSDVYMSALRNYIHSHITPPLSQMITELHTRGIIEATVINPEFYRRYEQEVYPQSTHSLIATLRELSIKGILDLRVHQADKLRAYDEFHTKCAFLSWFERLVGHGIPMLDEEIHLDPGKLRRTHNRSYLEELYHMQLDPVVINTEDVAPGSLNKIDLSLVRTIGDMPVGASLTLWALVDIESGYIDKIVHPETAFDEMQYGIAQFTVDMRDEDMLVATWDRGQPDLAVKGLSSDIIGEFRRQNVIVYKPTEQSLRLDRRTGKLMTPSEWMVDLPQERSVTQSPTTAMSEITPHPRGEPSQGDFIAEASGFENWW